MSIYQCLRTLRVSSLYMAPAIKALNDRMLTALCLGLPTRHLESTRPTYFLVFYSSATQDYKVLSRRHQHKSSSNTWTGWQGFALGHLMLYEACVVASLWLYLWESGAYIYILSTSSCPLPTASSLLPLAIRLKMEEKPLSQGFLCYVVMLA